MDTSSPTPNKPAPESSTAAAQPPHDAPKGGVLSRFLTVLFTPLLWIARPLVFRVGHEKGNPKVYFTSYSTLMYLWPIMVVGVVGHWMHSWHFASAATLGWIWLTVLLIVLICVASDLNRTKALVLVLVVALLWIAGVLLNSKYQIPILSNIHAFLKNQDVQFQPGIAKVMSIAVFIILIGVVLVAWFDGRYEITTMEITHRRIFETSDSLPRAAKRIKRQWRDFTEVILGIGAGDVIVIDTNKNVVMRIPNVPFLWFFRHDVDHVLEVLATTEVGESAAVEAAASHHSG